MKQLLVILLLIIVPFQLSWAAAGDYCQHESGATAQHFGHHTHQHQDNLEKARGKIKSAKIHPDCGACHNTVSALPPQVSTLFALPPLSAIHPSAEVSFTSHIPERPLRPERRIDV